jgi:hypothetical protein
MAPITGGPADYVAFCRSVTASACLYLPPSSYLSFDPATYTLADSDGFVTASTCAAEGGKWSGDGCYYIYPMRYVGTFTPPAPSPGRPIGSGVTSSKGPCTGDFFLTVDPRGGYALSATLKGVASSAGLFAYVSTGSAPWTCTANVYLPL